MAAALNRVAPTWYVQVAPLAADDSTFSRIMEEAKATSQERLKREPSANNRFAQSFDFIFGRDPYPALLTAFWALNRDSSSTFVAPSCI